MRSTRSPRNSRRASPPAANLLALAAAALLAAHTHAVVLSHVEANAAALTASRYDVITIDALDARDLVRRIRAGRRGRRVLAYVNVGEAERWRDYWRPDWRVGAPSFLAAPDPAGFAGDYPVRFRDPRWQRIVVGTPASLIDRALAAGFDGAFLDWVEVYRFAPVAHGDPAARAAMIAFIERIAAYARARRPGFAIVPLNAEELAADPRYRAAIDAVAAESIWRYDDSAARVARLDALRAAGLPVFTIDYERRPERVRALYARARRHGFVPYVGTRALDALTATPP